MNVLVGSPTNGRPATSPVALAKTWPYKNAKSIANMKMEPLVPAAATTQSLLSGVNVTTSAALAFGESSPGPK